MNDPRVLIASLRSTVCPACGGEKASRQSFCRNCYFVLPRHRRTSLYKRVGQGYESAFHAALQELNVDTPTWPDEKKYG